MCEVTDVEVRGVVRFLCLLGKENKEILVMLQDAYGDSSPSYSFVKKWAARFRAGRTDLGDDERSGRPGRTDIPCRLLEHLEEDPHMSLRSAAAELGVDKKTIHNVLVSLGMRFVSTKWVPHQLTPEVKCRRVTLARELVDSIDWESGPRMRNIITADESWFFHENPHEGRWIRDGESPDTVVSRSISAEKSMVVVFWNHTGALLVSVLWKGETFNSETAVEQLRRLDVAVREMGRPKRGLKGMRLHWDNARPHFSKLTRAEIDELGLSVLPHPPYSPDLAPSDFFLFGYLKEKLKGKHFPGGVGLLEGINEEISKIPKTTMCAVIENWRKRLTTVIELEGEYYSV